MQTPLLTAAILLWLTAACQRAASPAESAIAAPAPTAAASPGIDPRLRAPPSDSRLGVLVGEVTPADEDGMLVLALDVVASLEGDCGEFQQKFSGSVLRCEGVRPGPYTAFIRGKATRWARVPIYIKPGVITDLGKLELVPLPPEAVIRGVVRDSTGQPVEGVLVSYAISYCGAFDMISSLDWTTSTNAAGEFVLHPEGRQVEVMAYNESYRGAEWGRMAEWGDVLDLVVIPLK